MRLKTVKQVSLKGALVLGCGAASFAGFAQTAAADQYASSERSAAAVGHYARARAMLVEALAEFEAGRRIARPDLLLNSEQWRTAVVSRAEDLNRILDPQPRVTRSGVAFQVGGLHARRDFDQVSPSKVGVKDTTGSTVNSERGRLKPSKSRGAVTAPLAKREVITSSKPTPNAKQKAAAAKIPCVVPPEYLNTPETETTKVEVTKEEGRQVPSMKESVESAINQTTSSEVVVTSPEEKAEKKKVTNVVVSDSAQSSSLAVTITETKDAPVDAPPTTSVTVTETSTAAIAPAAESSSSAAVAVGAPEDQAINDAIDQAIRDRLRKLNAAVDGN